MRPMLSPVAVGDIEALVPTDGGPEMDCSHTRFASACVVLIAILAFVDAGFTEGAAAAIVPFKIQVPDAARFSLLCRRDEGMIQKNLHRERVCVHELGWMES